MTPIVVQIVRRHAWWIASDIALNTFFDTGGPVQFQPGFTARDKTDLMPLYLDVMTYATP
jgi:hypothetical protein